MGKIYDLHDSQWREGEYKTLIKEMIDSLKESYDDLYNDAVMMAFAEVWKEWTDEQASGGEIRITETMLLNCGDENVAALVGLLQKIKEVTAVLEKR